MRTHLLLLFCLYGLVLTAQPSALWIDDQVLDDPEYVSHVTQDPDGFYWLGSVSGLVRFDGKQAKNIEIADPGSPIRHGTTVTSRMFPAADRRLWFTTSSAIHAYHPATGRINTFRVRTPEGELADNYYGILLNESTGNLWLRAGDGIYSFSPATGESTLLGAPTAGVSYSYYREPDGTIRVFGSTFITPGLERLVVTASESDGRFVVLPSPLSFVHTTPLGANRLLAATSLGLREVTIEGSEVRSSSVSTDLPAGKCYGTARSSRPNHYWACFPTAGAYEIDLATGTIVRGVPTGSTQGLRQPAYLYLDKQGQLWITDINKGLLVLPEAGTGFHSTILPGPGAVHDLHQDEQQGVWAITEGGTLYRIRDAEVSDQTHLLGGITVARGRFYRAGFTWFLKGLTSMHRSSPGDGYWVGVPALMSVFPGIVAVRGRTLRVAGSNLREFQFRSDTLLDIPLPDTRDVPRGFTGVYPLTDSTFLAPNRGELLLQYRSDESGSLRVIRTDTLLATIYAYHQSRSGTIYLGTDNGLFRYTSYGPERILNELGPFFSSVISCIGEDQRGRLWIGSSRGLLCYDPTSNEVRRYSKEDGLPANQFTNATPVTLPDGSMYMATTEGLIRFDPEEILANEPPLRSYLSEVWVNQLPISGDSSLPTMDYLRLKHSRNSIDLSPGLIGLRQSGLAGFNYRLKGLEEESSFVVAGQRIKYPKLPPGDYRFEYAAVNRHGVVAPAKSLDVTIVPKFTQTRAFLLLVVGAITLLLSLLYGFLLRRERARQQRLREDREKIMAERERIASELHDDLGGDLASMVFILDGHQYLREQGVDSDLDIERIGNLANGAIRNMREMIWVLDEQQTTPAALAELLLTTAREMARAAGLHFQANIVEDLPDITLSSLQKKNILLIAKETMQNIRKHARATTFTLRFAGTTGGTLVLEITDNGRGLAAARQEVPRSNHGHGLANLKKRATDIGGTFTLSPAIPTGTRMRLTLPLSPLTPTP